MGEDERSQSVPENGRPADAIPRKYRVEHRVAGMDAVVLAVIENVFPHHDTLTQFVSRFLNEQGDEPLSGELVLVEETTDRVLARRDLGRACSDGKRGRQRSRRGTDD